MPSESTADPDLGEVRFESRPSLIRRIALSVVLLPIGLLLLYSSMMFTAFHLGLLENEDWDVPMWFAPLPLAAGLLFLFATGWYLRRAFRCHEGGVCTRGLFRTNKLQFSAINSVRMRISESQWLGIILVFRVLEVWFEPKDVKHQPIAFTYLGYGRPLTLASRIETIVKSVGISPQWDRGS